LKFQVRDIGTWSASVWPFRRLCYRPAVFFHYCAFIPTRKYSARV
jgi:hypothetical protein